MLLQTDFVTTIETNPEAALIGGYTAAFIIAILVSWVKRLAPRLRGRGVELTVLAIGLSVSAAAMATLSYDWYAVETWLVWFIAGLVLARIARGEYLSSKSDVADRAAEKRTMEIRRELDAVASHSTGSAGPGPWSADLPAASPHPPQVDADPHR